MAATALQGFYFPQDQVCAGLVVNEATQTVTQRLLLLERKRGYAHRKGILPLYNWKLTNKRK